MTLSRLILSATAIVWMAFSTPQAFAAGNTNQCVQDLGGILSCQDRNALGLPNDLQACCDGVRQLSVDSCHCNPAVDTVLGEKGTKIYDLEAICRIVQPKKWTGLTPFFLRKCDAVKTNDYGCEKTDIEIDGERIKSIFKYNDAFKGALDEKVCLDTPKFTKNLNEIFRPDINVTVPYGVGTYVGTQNAAEYLGMDFAGMTHGFWVNDATSDPTKPARLDVSSDGKTWTLGITTKGNFLRGKIQYSDKYLEHEVKFQGCESKISEIILKPTDGMRFAIENYVQAVDLSKRWGVEDICRYHTKFCADDPKTRQYASEDECREYIRSLPLHSPACGPNRPLSGTSLSCKFKHHFMIPANPQMHCAHIGRKGTVDIDDHLKCDDAAECSQDIGQDSWPPVENVGENVSDELRKIYEESNVGWESEPMGCAVPSEHIHGK